MANKWFKFYGGEYLSDPKILQLDADERSCWTTLLCLASQSEDGSIKFLSEAQLLILSGVIREKKGVLQKFEKLDMLRICNGTVTLLNWQKRQYSEGYLRVKNFRKRKSNAKDNDRIEENRIEENNNNAVPPKGDIVNSLLEDKGGIQHEYQYLGLEVFEKTNAPKGKKSECIRLAREHPNLIQPALSFCLDYPNPALKWKMFLWKLNDLRKKVREKNEALEQNKK